MKVLVFIGPSGSGKSTLLRDLHRRGLVEATPSWTTRPRREEEVSDDIEHRFVSDREFSELQSDGFFLEAIEMFGFRYGLPTVEPSPGNSVPAFSVRASLLDLVSIHFPNNVVYQIECDLESVKKRVEARQLPPAEVQDRLQRYADELALGRRLCNRVFDTSFPPQHVAAAVERAISEDFQTQGSSVAWGQATDHYKADDRT